MKIIKIKRLFLLLTYVMKTTYFEVMAHCHNIALKTLIIYSEIVSIYCNAQYGQTM